MRRESKTHGAYPPFSSYQKALALYQKIHADAPDNLECLRYLVAICKDLSHPYEKYQLKLVKLERVAAARTQSDAGALTRLGGAGGGPRPGPSGGNNSTGDTHTPSSSPMVSAQDAHTPSLYRGPETTDFKPMGALQEKPLKVSKSPMARKTLSKKQDCK